jgi:mono/diheme cytochrome c family protein
LKKGTNSVLARFTPPKDSNAFVRLFWSSRDWPLPIPISSSALSHESSDAVIRGRHKAQGALLLAEYHCTSCHATVRRGFPELERDAPSFEGIGSRLTRDWMARWIENPAAVRPGAHMPRLFSGDDAGAKAQAAAAYLTTLVGQPAAMPAGSRERGEHLYNALNCAACHSPQPLLHVSAKYKQGALSNYLRNPQAHYHWNPMPNFGLNTNESADLEFYLKQVGDSKRNEQSPSAAQIQLGKQLVETSGCLNCHSSNASDHRAFSDLDALVEHSSGGCLSESPLGNAPRFSFASGDRETIRAFIAEGDFRALAGNIPRDFAQREIARLGCAECHDKAEGLPKISLAGEKLKPEWMSAFIAGKVPYKPRPWLAMRMPSFPAYARELAEGLAASHGRPFVTPSEPPVNSEAASIGAKLVSANGGFSCVACHAVEGAAPPANLEAPGINFAFAGQRLSKSFFERWVMNPVTIDHATKMPVFFDAHGQSQLLDVLDGDGREQINAIWEYVRSLHP